jgi:hypothetical protein
MSATSPAGRGCPALDPRLGRRAFCAAMVHAVASRGHANCASDRIALVLLMSLLEARRDLHDVLESLTDAVELLKRVSPSHVPQEPATTKTSALN